ncbi:MAG: hypothetical protein GY788_12385 [bacterium]|nr:hypothetical protein [bacterium]
MNQRANVVLFKSVDRVPSQRVRDSDAGYRAATDALILAADLGCSGDIYEGLWSICERELQRYEASQGRAP